MSELIGQKALNGEFERISVRCIKIDHDMTMTFTGKSCNVMNKAGEVIHTLDESSGVSVQDVSAGDRCYIMRASVKFEKKENAA